MGVTAQLVGIGTALPRTRVAQRDLAGAAAACCCNDQRQTRLLHELYRRAGVETRGCAILDDLPPSGGGAIQRRFPPARHGGDRGPTLAERMAMYHPAAVDLAVRAARAALDDAQIGGVDLGHVVLVSCTGFAAPGVDLALMESLDLPRSTPRTNVGFMGCHGAVNGLRVAAAHAEALKQPTLLVCVEVCTAHFAYGWHPERVVANALFADGAAAAVLVPGEHNGGHTIAKVGASLSAVVPESRDAMSWHIGDHGFEMSLRPAVPGLIEKNLPALLDEWLERNGTDSPNISGWAVHPGGPRILGAALRAAGLNPTHGDVSREVLRNHGNMSSPTVLFILERLRQRDTNRPWLALAFGPGLSIEGVLFD